MSELSPALLHRLLDTEDPPRVPAALIRQLAAEVLRLRALTDGLWLYRALLEELQDVLEDAINHGAPSHSSHEEALVAVRTLLDNPHDQAAARLWLDRKTFDCLYRALSDIMYGRRYSQTQRDQLLERLQHAGAEAESEAGAS
ncbi:hypothetical protein [Pseudomonas sp. NW5]|uniref:hypothetical protein n=1 Tax=Pseudomonas sp. NW5 TaxID=2934934 RepID=UPI00202256A2|nr:hypothetical protein [Pseudomonas sp. NW5]MCL7462217.1 hypothetical protein [Pseudomonas sp. NW5]